MIAKTPGRSDDDVSAVRAGRGLRAHVHAADAGRRRERRPGVEPGQLAMHLQRELAGRGDDERQRLCSAAEVLGVAEQGGSERQAEGDGLAGARLGGDEQVAPRAPLRGRRPATAVGSL